MAAVYLVRSLTPRRQIHGVAHHTSIASFQCTQGAAALLRHRNSPTSDSGDDRAPGALDDGHDLGPLGRRDCELVERLRHVVHERVPLARRDTQVAVGALHRSIRSSTTVAML